MQQFRERLKPKLQVFLDKKDVYGPGEIDGIQYLKIKGEHLMGVYLADYRAGRRELGDFIYELDDMIFKYGDEIGSNY